MFKTIKVLDGEVTLLDKMGDDKAIVDAARVTHKKSKRISDDRKLIRYLIKHGHLTPFEMCELKFYIKLPIFVARQMVRHRTASLNEISGRYTEMEYDFYNPKKFRKQSKENKQMSENDDIKYEISCYDKVYTEYNSMINKGIAREQARIVLPLSLYTEWVWKMDLRNLLHFLELRLHKHAQYETRLYAQAIAEIVKELFPLTWEAFENYRLKAITFSYEELLELSILLGNKIEGYKSLLNNKERKEFYNKIKKIKRL